MGRRSLLSTVDDRTAEFMIKARCNLPAIAYCHKLSACERVFHSFDFEKMLNRTVSLGCVVIGISLVVYRVLAITLKML